MEVKKIEEEKNRLAHKLKIQPLVTKAKYILMSKQKIDEPEAYRMMQKISMDNCAPLQKTAQIIIDTEGEQLSYDWRKR